MQVQIQALLAAVEGGAVQGRAGGSGLESHMEMAKPAIFNGEAGKVGDFVIAYRSYLKMKMREETVEEQVMWVLSYVQGGSADIWKENVMEKLEAGEMEYELIEEFFTSMKKKFGGGEEEATKAVELRQLEQEERPMEEFVQIFKRIARESRYEGRPLIEEFKRGINGGIRRKLMEAENLLVSIEQWYQRATALDRNCRESKREKERLKKKKVGGGTQKQERQSLPRPLVWQRRQPLPQQATTGSAPIEGIERTNMVVVRGSEVGGEQNMGAPPRWDPFAMEVDWS